MLYKVLQQEEQPKWTDGNIKLTIKKLAKPLLTRVLRKRLNPTRDSLATSLSATAIATATIPPKTQTPTPITPQLLIALVPQQPAQPTAITTTLLGTQIPTPIIPIALVP